MFILLNLSLINFIQLCFVIFNSLTLLMTCMTVLLYSVSWSSTRKFSLSNFSKGLVGLERSCQVNLSPCWYYCDEIWALWIIFLVFSLIWTEQVETEKSMWGWVWLNGWKWMGWNEVSFDRGHRPDVQDVPPCPRLEYGNEHTGWRVDVSWEGPAGLGTGSEGPEKVGGSTDRGGQTRLEHWIRVPG